MGSPLVRWLASLDPDGLAEILRRRPETLVAPCPGSLTGLAARLQERRHAIAALRELPWPAGGRFPAIHVLPMVSGSPPAGGRSWLRRSS